MPAQRFDRVELKASTTAEGFIQDAPILTRSGIFDYRGPDGKLRREYRPPEEVFHADSLASYRGKPITDGHPGLVTASNAKVHTVGTLLTEGRRDGDDARGDVVIYDTAPIAAGKKELSLGYTLDIDETPGEINGERYDAIQRNIRVNHLALVPRGRAGNARLNLDAADADTTEEDTTMTMVKVRLDSGISYDAAPEVANALQATQDALTAARADIDKEKARADAAEAKLGDAEKATDKIRADAAAAAKARILLEDSATKVGASFKPDATDTEIRSAVIKKVRGDSFDLTGKTDGYIEAAYDLAIAEKGQRQDAVASQRQDLAGQRPAGNAPEVRQDARSARERMIARNSGETTEE
ncbi:DUF2213 domain-containing protein [Stenotrophomonas maltophilia]|uniref:DUF2213 domain-containing protein n=1 Tax=Stenotrophomonas maltophilia TaxID=40324 RepID=UPI001559F834|nr:DUF2213 domain-containing protein [Stenotrophomonas maltophilia]